jgi:hypothetical protein
MLRTAGVDGRALGHFRYTKGFAQTVGAYLLRIARIHVTQQGAWQPTGCRRDTGALCATGAQFSGEPRGRPSERRADTPERPLSPGAAMITGGVPGIFAIRKDARFDRPPNPYSPGAERVVCRGLSTAVSL